MAIPYAPYIEGVIPAFTAYLLRVPHQLNPGVSKNTICDIVAKISTLNNEVLGYFIRVVDPDIFEESELGIQFSGCYNKSNPTTNHYYCLSESWNSNDDNHFFYQSKEVMSPGQYYKIQLAYSDINFSNYERSNDNSIDLLSKVRALTYSSVGIGKYLGIGVTDNYDFDKENKAYDNRLFQISRTRGTTKLNSGVGRFFVQPTKFGKDLLEESNEALYSCTIGGKEYLLNSGEMVFQKLNTNTNLGLGMPICKTVNGYVEEIYAQYKEYKYIDVETLTLSLNQNISSDKCNIFSKDTINWYPVSNPERIMESDTEYYIGKYNPSDTTINYKPYQITYDTISLIGADGKELFINFNPKISSFKTVVQEQKTETIGGKYPIFFRNGNLSYKEFPINCLISYHMDVEQKFMKQDELGLNNTTNLPTTNLTNYNITAERRFRQAVLDWLNDGQAKIFKSSTEGVYLIRLMNVSLTPEDKLGRMIYSFQATAYELDSISYDNLIKYGFEKKLENINYVI